MVQQFTEGITKTHVFSSYLKEKSGLLLDLGCGVGDMMQHVTNSQNVVGLDLSIEYCQKAQSQGEHTICANLEYSLPFKNEVFDVIICSDVFEHLKFPMNTLQEIHRIIKTDGLLLTHIPNEFGYKSLFQILRGNGICNRNFLPDTEEWDYPHIRFFSYTGFKSMLKQGGFAIEDDLTNFGRGWRRFFYPLFGSGPSFVAKKVGHSVLHQ